MLPPMAGASFRVIGGYELHARLAVGAVGASTDGKVDCVVHVRRIAS